MSSPHHGCLCPHRVTERDSVYRLSLVSSQDSFKTAKDMDDRIDLDLIDELRGQLEEKDAIIERLEKEREERKSTDTELEVSNSEVEILKLSEENDRLKIENSTLRETNKELHNLADDKDNYIASLENSKRTFQYEMEKALTEKDKELEEKTRQMSILESKLSQTKKELGELKKQHIDQQVHKKNHKTKGKSLPPNIHLHVQASAASSDTDPPNIDLSHCQLEPDMCSLYNWLIPSIASQWKVLGYQLKLSNDVIRRLEAEHPHNLQDCCREMLLEWEKQQTSPHTWGTIIEALMSPAIGRRDIAQNIARHLK